MIVKSKKHAMLLFSLVLAFSLVSPALFHADSVKVSALTHAKIDMTGMSVINEQAKGDATLLIDEQVAAGDPLNGTGAVVSNKWTPSGDNYVYPASAVIDLGVDHEISEIYLFDSNNSGNVTISTGTPYAWTVQFTDPMTAYMTWKRHSVNLTTRYIRVTLANGVGTPEIVVYGAALGTPAPTPTPVPHTPPTMDAFIGINAFVDDPIDKLQVAGHIREYHSWRWDEGCADTMYPGYPNNENAWSPSCAGGGWDFDEFYDDLNGLGIEVSPALQGSTVWISGSNTSVKPLSSGEDELDPASYIEHGDHLFQYAARYGSTVVNTNLLKLRSDQAANTGLDLIRYYENWNEPNNWWSGVTQWFSPAAFAAMSSADYDGHLSALGGTVGVKNADPNAKLVMGGLASLDLEYLRAMKFWADHNRGGSFPADVINVHHYSNDGGFQMNGTVGVSPEDDNLKDKVAQIVDWRDRYLPGKEVWVSEFGYDTNAGSPQRAPAIGWYSNVEVQAQWLVRSYLALAAAGVDRAQMYMLRNVSDLSSGRYNTSGLTTSQADGYQPKRSWYYLYTMKNRLGGMRFMEEQASGRGDVLIYKFKSATGNNGAYVVWCPTSNVTEVPGYVLSLTGSPTAASRVSMVDGDTDGVEASLTISGAGTVQFNVGERPVFILVDDI